MARVIKDIAEMQRTSEELRLEGRRIGVVPTMGYLHEGHLSLIRAIRELADVVTTTVFVNPTQFGPSEDFSRYPRNFDRDVHLATEAGSTYIFAPDTSRMYQESYATYVNVEGLSNRLEGKSRPGHFRGVVTVVTKLFNITKPHVAIFGQKDAQQVVVIKQMVADMNFDIEIVVAPTVREPDGLAMSSRNDYLSPEQRRETTVLYRSLQLADRLIRAGERSCDRLRQQMTELITSQSSGVIDYISIADNRTLEELTFCEVNRPLLVSLAVRFGSTRLIDNITLTT